MRRLDEFWRQRGTLGKVLIMVVAAVVAFGISRVFGMGYGEATISIGTITTIDTTTEAKATGPPLACLDEAGLSNVEERSTDFWRGYHDGPFYQVSVQELSSAAEARDLVRDAIDVYAVQSGRFVVTGPAKPSAGGLVTSEEGLEANRILQEVAACLGG